MSVDHEAHDLPLADRLVTEAILAWLNTATGLALAGCGEANEHEKGFRQGVEQLRYLHLDGFYYTVVPKILDQLRRAGLLQEARA